MANLKRIEKMSESYAMHLADAIKSRRVKSGMTMTRLAEESGVTQQVVSLLEKGARVPSITTVFRLAHGLGTTPLDIIREVEAAMVIQSKPGK